MNIDANWISGLVFVGEMFYVLAKISNLVLIEQGKKVKDDIVCFSLITTNGQFCASMMLDLELTLFFGVLGF